MMGYKTGKFLIWIYLFFGVVRTEDSCPDFDQLVNGEIFYMVQEINRLYHVAEIVCNDNYDLFPDIPDGFNECIEADTWEYPEFTCEERCEVPRRKGTSFYYSDGGLVKNKTIKHDVELRKKCGKGYEDINQETVKCDKGTLRGSSECTPKRCEVPRITKTSFYTSDGELVKNKTIKHDVELLKKCDKGYEDLNQEEVKCDKGTLRGSSSCTPTSEPFCPDFDELNNGEIYYMSEEINKVYHVAEIKCNDNYDLFPDIPDGYNECVANNTWEYPEFTCEGRLTVGPGDKMYLYYGTERRRGRRIHSPKVVKSRTLLTSSCYRNYELYDESTKTYVDKRYLDYRVMDGKLQPNMASCVEERCEVPRRTGISFYTSDGDLVGTGHKIEHDVELQKKCDKGYEDLKQEKVKCDKGTLRGSSECTKKRCQIPGERDAKNKRTYRTYSADSFIEHGDTVYKSCTQKEELYYPDQQIYDDDQKFESKCNYGTWTEPTFPVCKEKRCTVYRKRGTSFYTSDGQLVKSGQKIEHVVELQKNCDKGYEDLKQETVKCYKGTLRGSSECTKKRCQIPGDRDARSRYVRYSADSFIEHGVTVYKSCTQKEELFYPDQQIYDDDQKFESTCNYGTWTEPTFPVCKEKRCTVYRKIGTSFYTSDGKLVKFGQKIEHGVVLQKKCDEKYEDLKQREVRCDRGTLRGSSACTPKRCQIPEGRDARKSRRRREILEANSFVENGVTVYKRCENRKELYYPDQQIYDIDQKFESKCNYGTWTEPTFPVCIQGCLAEIVTGTTYEYQDGIQITSEQLVQNGTSLVFICNDKHTISYRNKSTARVNASITCLNGNFVPEFKCVSNSNDQYGVTTGVPDINNDMETTTLVGKPQPQITGGMTVDETDDAMTPRVDPAYESNYEYYDYFEGVSNSNDQRGVTTGAPDINNDMETTTLVGKPQPQITGGMTADETDDATTPRVEPTYESNYEYYDYFEDSCQITRDIAREMTVFGREMGKKTMYFEGTNFEAGKRLFFNCKMKDMEPVNRIFKCINGLWVSIRKGFNMIIDNDNPECRPVKAASCTAPTNGKLHHRYLSIYEVTCDEGYTLNVIKYERQFLCVGGKLQSRRFKLEPVCEEDSCIITSDMSRRMKVFGRERGEKKFYSEGFEFEAGIRLYFDCKEDAMEPVNRIFNCIKGHWVAIERDFTMTIDNAAPDCRQVNCGPGCQFGGTCVKDGRCDCPPATEGDHCEIPKCQANCTENGGECVRLNTCKCPPPRYGTVCELVGCLPPSGNKDLLEDQRPVFRRDDILRNSDVTCGDGHVLSTPEDFVCTGDNIWSPGIACVEGTAYTIEFKVNSNRWSGSWSPMIVAMKTETGTVIGDISFPDAKFPGNIHTRIKQFRYIGKVHEIDITLNTGRGYDAIIMDYMLITADDELRHEEYRLTNINSTGARFSPKLDVACSLPKIDGEYKNSEKKVYFSGDSLSSNDIKCNNGLSPSLPSVTCQENGQWTGTLTCAQEAEYDVAIHFGSSRYAGEYGGTLTLTFKDSDRQYQVVWSISGGLDPNAKIKREFKAVYIPEITSLDLHITGIVKPSVQIETIHLKVDKNNDGKEYIFTDIGWVNPKKTISPDLQSSHDSPQPRSNERIPVSENNESYDVTILSSTRVNRGVIIIIQGKYGNTKAMVFSERGLKNGLNEKTFGPMPNIGNVRKVILFRDNGRFNIKYVHVRVNSSGDEYVGFPDEVTEKRADIEVQKLYKAGCEGTTYTSNIIYGYHQHVYYIYIHLFWTPSVDHCTSKCSTDERCRAVRFYRGNRECYLLDTNELSKIIFSNNYKDGEVYFRTC